MMNVAIAEDEREQREILKRCLKRYGSEQGEAFSVSEFSDGAELVNLYRAQFGLVFLDIEMERMDGMEAAEIIRKTDSATAIIFVTRLAHLAVRGYDVGALDFIVKPVSYESFAMKMRRAVAYVGSAAGGSCSSGRPKASATCARRRSSMSSPWRMRSYTTPLSGNTTHGGP